jgi:phosphotransferase system HPr (HPr) family protein
VELERCVTISNKFGLHARASTRLAQLASVFQSEVRLSRQDNSEEVDAKSILGLLTLGAEKGQVLRVRVLGDDAEKAMEAIADLFARGFEEDEE